MKTYNEIKKLSNQLIVNTPAAVGENFADELKQLVREIEVNRENE